jgi:hypothetical protein
MTTLRGGCHCGNISVEFETGLDPNALQLRACQCSFCRRHGARTASDPKGRLRISVRDAELLVRYRFALGVTDFLVCKSCGTYVAATMEAAARRIGTVNVNVLDEREPFLRQAEPVNYFRENVEQRVARRLLAWMPVEVRSCRSAS